MTSRDSAKPDTRQTVLIVEDDLATGEALCDLLDSSWSVSSAVCFGGRNSLRYGILRRQWLSRLWMLACRA